MCTSICVIKFNSSKTDLELYSSKVILASLKLLKFIADPKQVRHICEKFINKGSINLMFRNFHKISILHKKC